MLILFYLFIEIFNSVFTLNCLYQQIGLKFEEETSKMLHLEHGFLWC